MLLFFPRLMDLNIVSWEMRVWEVGVEREKPLLLGDQGRRGFGGYMWE